MAPCSYTSKESEANEAATGNYVYVIEAQWDKTTKTTIYRLGYKYRAFESIYLDDKGNLWPGKKKYKNTPKKGFLAEGFYFKDPVEITDLKFIKWYKRPSIARAGMFEIEPHFVPVLDALFANPLNDAQPYILTS